MTDRTSNVRKLDVQPSDILHNLLSRGLRHFKAVRRSIKVDIWRASVTADETTITAELDDARH